LANDGKMKWNKIEELKKMRKLTIWKIWSFSLEFEAIEKSRKKSQL